MVQILQKEAPVLRQISLPVAHEMFGTAELKKILRDMKTALDSQEDGVAIAAPQIGVSFRIFVVSGHVFEMLHPEKVNPKKKPRDIVFINPEIVKLSKDRAIMEEGCLSVRYLYGKIERAKKAKVKAQNEKGEEFEMEGTGLLAQIFQHETDHLDGKLFIDTAVDVEELPPKERSHESVI